MLTSTHLTTGWEHHLDVGDSLLRRHLFHHAALGAAVTLAGGGRVLDASDVSMADLGRPGGYFNAAVLLAPPADWDAVLTRVEHFFRRGRGPACLWSAWPSPDLRSRGWRLSGHPPLLIRPPLSVNPVTPAPSAGLDVRPVTTPAELAGWERVAIDGYPFAELRAAPRGSFVSPALLDDDRVRFFVGRDRDRPVASAAAFVSHGLASLSFATTLPHARRRGFWRRLAVERLQAAPDAWATGVFTDLSRPSAEALGFIPVLRLTLWILDRP